MKRTVKFLALFLFVTCIITTFPRDVFAKSKLSQEKQKQIYKEVIAEYDSTIRANTHESELMDEYPEWKKECATYYKMVDIDGNGILELVLNFRFIPNDGTKVTTANGSTYGDCFALCTLDNNGKVKKVISWDDMVFFPFCNDGACRLYKNSRYFESYPPTSAAEVGYSYYKNGKFTSHHSLYTNEYKNKTIYEYDGKKVSKKVYQKKYKKFTGTGKGYVMKRYSK